MRLCRSRVGRGQRQRQPRRPEPPAARLCDRVPRSQLGQLSARGVGPRARAPQPPDLGLVDQTEISKKGQQLLPLRRRAGQLVRLCNTKDMAGHLGSGMAHEVGTARARTVPNRRVPSRNRKLSTSVRSTPASSCIRRPRESAFASRTAWRRGPRPRADRRSVFGRAHVLLQEGPQLRSRPLQEKLKALGGETRWAVVSSKDPATPGVSIQHAQHPGQGIRSSVATCRGARLWTGSAVPAPAGGRRRWTAASPDRSEA